VHPRERHRRHRSPLNTVARAMAPASPMQASPWRRPTVLLSPTTTSDPGVARRFATRNVRRRRSWRAGLNAAGFRDLKRRRPHLAADRDPRNRVSRGIDAARDRMLSPRPRASVVNLTTTDRSNRGRRHSVLDLRRWATLADSGLAGLDRARQESRRSCRSNYFPGSTHSTPSAFATMDEALAMTRAGHRSDHFSADLVVDIDCCPASIARSRPLGRPLQSALGMRLPDAVPAGKAEMRDDRAAAARGWAAPFQRLHRQALKHRSR
jgi:hypothetical protein